MEIMHHIIGTVLVVDIPEGVGRLAGTDIDDFIHGILQVVTPSIKTIAFDMARQEFLNSAGLGELVKVKDSLMDRNIELALINLSSRVISLIDIAGVDRFFVILESEDELLQR